MVGNVMLLTVAIAGLLTAYAIANPFDARSPQRRLYSLSLAVVLLLSAGMYLVLPAWTDAL
jgi:hypothetical protein